MSGATSRDRRVIPETRGFVVRRWLDDRVPAYVAHALQLVWPGADRADGMRFVASLEHQGDGRDLLLVDGDGLLVAARSIDELDDRSTVLGHPLYPDDEEPPVVDVLGARARVRARPSSDDCEAVVDAWNVAEELGRAVGRPLGFTGRDASRAYEKALWGHLAERMHPDRGPYAPWLSPREQRKTRQVLDRGARLLAAHLGP
jgi:hypothetical protein